MPGTDEEVEPRVAVGGSLGEKWETWSKKFEDGQLNSSDFRSYWAFYVPKLFALNPQVNCMNPKFDEKAIKYTLLQCLEKFITNSSDPNQVINQLKQKESPSTFCGRVFKTGEPTYSCRDCGVDPTCVMCAACFKASVHCQHKYRMNMSRGGGYCDCGDHEAWKTSPTCEIHDKESKADEDVIPQDMQARMRLVTESVLTYAYQLLTWNKYTELPTDLEVSKKKEWYVMMLFNDETHTYEQVISSLNRAIDADERKAVEFAATVDREGRSMITIDGFTECSIVKSSIERSTSRNGSKPLKTAVMTVSLVSHQMFASRAIQWMDNFCKNVRGFARIVGNVLITVPTSPIDIYPLVRCVMRHDTQLWKSARQLWHQLLINGILMDPESKLKFAKMFARDYPDLMKEFIADDHEHTMSVMSLSVQIFSVVSVAQTLIAEDGVLSALLRTFLSEAAAHKHPTTGKLAFDRNHASTSFKRAQFVLGDLRYLLYVKPTGPWSEELRKSFSSGIECLLQLLSDLQGMDAVVRQVGQHVEFEAEWETGINIQLKIGPVLGIILEWCELDKDILIRAIRRTLDHLVRADKSCGDVEYVSRSLGPGFDEVRCVDYDVSSQPISVHLSLSRFLSGLLLATQKFGLDFFSHQLEIPAKPSLIQVMEQPLRLQVMLAQFRAGMWRRNGYSPLNQVFFYTNFRLRAETLDRDICMLQYAAAKMDPNEFYIHVLNKYELLPWFSSPEYFRPSSEGSPDMSGPLSDDFLTLILYLLAERHIPGVGDVTEMDRVKQEMIQMLCIEPSPHSSLVKQLPARYEDSALEMLLEEVLREIAIFKRVPTAVGKYELKPDYFKYFNPFYYHFSREEQSKAEEVQLKRRKAAGLPPFIPPPVLPNFSAEFKPILNLLDCDVFAHIVTIILHRCISGPPLYSDAQLERALHLVGIGFDEVKRGGLSQRFLDRMLALKDLFEQAIQKLSASPSLLALASHIVMMMNQPADGQCSDVTMTQAGPEDSSGRSKRGRNAELAAARRAKIMAAMSSQQDNFMEKHGHMFEEAADKAQDEEEEDKPKFICILCREEEVVSLQAKKSLVVSAFVQKSAVLQKSARDNPEESAPLAMGLPPSDLRGGAHISTCGHVMHSLCWQAFYELVQTKERRRPVRYGRHVSFDVAQGEFLCPLCECLSNTVIPLVPCQKDETFLPVPERLLSDWLDNLRTIADTALPMVTEEAETMLHRFLQTTSQVVLGDEDDPYLALTWTLAYTIQATEWCIRSENKALLADISSRKLYCLENMVKATQMVSLMGITKGSNVASDCLQALRCILLAQTEVDSCILEIDPFGLLCLLHFSLHRISDYDTFSLNKNLLSLVIALHLVQIIISLYLQMDKQEDVAEAEAAAAAAQSQFDKSRINKFAGEVLHAAGLSADSRFPPASRVIDALVPFLRATAILQYFISPKDCGGWMRNNSLNDAPTLCSFIGLSVEHLDSIVNCRSLRELALSWARQPKVLHLATSHWKPIYPLKVNSLINLPTDYSELINYISLLTCPSSDGQVNILSDEVRTPSMCLVCGAVLCSQSYCCQTTWGNQRVGACVAHAAKCSAGVGVFLRVRDCRVMLLVGDSKGSYSIPPYVDEYGETDPGLMRGNPLSLCASAYTQLNQMWLTHGMPEQVAHALEASTNLSSTNWSLM